MTAVRDGAPAVGRPPDPAPAADRTPTEPVAPTRPVSRSAVLGVAAFLVTAALVAAGHALTAVATSARVATDGEVRLAVVASRGAAALGSLPVLAPWDRLAAWQLAAVETVLPAGDPVAAARWACLVLGVAAVMAVWPVLRGLKLPVTATAAGVAVVGLALPLLTLRAGITAAAPATLWLAVAALLAVRDRGRIAVVVALVAVATCPLVLAGLLACAAHLVGTRAVRTPLPRVLGAVLALAATAVAVLASGRGPLASVAGPETSPLLVACVAAAVLVLAAVAARWLRPILAGGLVLVAVQVAALVVPGTAGPAATLVAAPALAAAVAVLAERVRARRAVAVPLAVAGAALLAVPLVAQAATPVAAPAPASLAAWIVAGTGRDAPVQADPLDRAALLAAGLSPDRLLDPSAPAPDGALRLVSLRPGGTVVPCPAETTLAATARGTGGAPASVCRVGAPAKDERASRARVGAQLAANPAVTGGPAVAAALRAGDVDPRLLMMLIALSGQHRLDLADLPAVPLDAAGTPRRQALLATFDGTPAAASTALRAWLIEQRPLLSPTIVGSGSSLLVTYPVPAPPGLLPP